VKLGLGTVQFGMDYGIARPASKTPASEVAMILAQASKAGMNVLDTAMEYGDCEAVLGGADVKGWKVVTKLPGLPENKKGNIDAWARNAVKYSMSRLGVSELYGLLLHKPAQLRSEVGKQLFNALSVLRDEGLVRKIGVSIYEPEELDSYLDIGRIDLVQAPLNLLDRRLITSGWLERLLKQDTAVHVRSVFLQGLLLMGSDERPEQFKRWSQVWSSLDAWLDDAGLDRLSACLAFINSVDGIEAAIVGVNSIEQLNQILGAMKTHSGPFPDFTETAGRELLDPRAWPNLH
jgi:aryl-alcohol dehydrogenase-like predicted oxidoreductase